jgi:pimeloyl-ACP methyl ester carboxylesterase
MSRQLIRKLLLYCFSIFLFWNLLVAVRAYRFSHFNKFPTIAETKNAGFFGFVINRISGRTYYKIPIQHLPSLPYQTIYLNTSNGLKLEGWQINAVNPKGTVLLFHGFGSNKEQVLQEAYAFHEMGYNSLLIDFRAHGNSEGSACTLGVSESEDVKCTFDYITASGEKNIILWGGSMGAASIAHAIYKYGIKPGKIILEMPFANYEELVQYYFRYSKYPTQPTAALFTFWAGVWNREWFFNMKPSNYVKAITCPVLLQWGINDELVPESATNKIYNNIAAEKQLMVYQKSGHQSFCANEADLWKQTVSAFLNR